MDRYYRVPDVTREDIRNLRHYIEQFKEGRFSEAKFRAFRVPLGVYEQREPGRYMMRIRVPGGGVSPAQLKAVAGIARRIGALPHLTTRQDLQLQNVGIDDIVPAYQELYRNGLTCKGGGGNTVRNITACPLAGICKDENFDVLPHVIALTEYLIQFPSSFNLPRKFKLAFSGCGQDCALATVHDLGFVAHQRDSTDGFAVYAAGGMGAHARVATKIESFVPADEIGYVAEAVKRLFDKHGERKNKHRARLRFVLEKMGPDRFREAYREELKAVKAEGPIFLETRPVVEPDPPDERGLQDFSSDEAYEVWKGRFTERQKQPGFSAVTLPVPLGDLAPADLDRIAGVVEKVRGATVRVTQTQDFLIQWVSEAGLRVLYDSWDELSQKRAGSSLGELVCCTGSATCKLGLCLSQSLARAVADRLDEANLSLVDLEATAIRINGCPNACGHHPVAALGLHGGSRRVEGRLAPHYNLHIGGRVEEGKTRLGEPVAYVPAKDVPEIVAEFVAAFRDTRNGSFVDFAVNEGRSVLEKIIESKGTIPSYEDNAEYYRDWGANEDFSLAGRGPGECGAGVFDMIEADIEESERRLAAFEQNGGADRLFPGVAAAARSLLVTRGVDPEDDGAALREFEKHFVETGIVDDKFRDLIMAAIGFSSDGDEEGLLRARELARPLLQQIRELYDSLDSNLEFETAKGPAGGLGSGEADARVATEKMDLRGVPCPINYVKAKLVLEGLNVGDRLEMLLDDGEPIANVPSSLKNDGQAIVDLRKENGHYFLSVEKRV